MHTLKQKPLFKKNREYRILETKLFFRESKVEGEHEFNIQYEDIASEKTSYKSANGIFLVFSAVMYVLSVITFAIRNEPDVEASAWAILVILATVLLVVYFYNRENSWKIKLSNNNYIFFHKNSPDADTVEKFIDELFRARNKYLCETYMRFDENLNYETQVNDLKWLKRVEAISKAEFDEKYSELQALFNLSKPKKSIGFDK